MAITYEQSAEMLSDYLLKVRNVIPLTDEERKRNQVTWMTLDRPIEGPFIEVISPPWLPPELLYVVGEMPIYTDLKTHICINYAPDPYHMKYTHLGRYHQGYAGDETLIIRAFKFETFTDGSRVLRDHEFINSPEQLEALGLENKIINECFPDYETKRNERQNFIALVQANMRGPSSLNFG